MKILSKKSSNKLTSSTVFLLFVCFAFTASAAQMLASSTLFFSDSDHNCDYNENMVEAVPIAVCNNQLVVAIGTEQAQVTAAVFGDGSNPNGGATLEIRRNHWLNNSCDESENQWSNWSDNVDIYCCDLNTDVILELRVTDEQGDMTSCSSSITIEDNLAPYCTAPVDVDISVENTPADLPDDLELAYADDPEGTSVIMNTLFGEATGTDNCAVDKIVEIMPEVNVNDCGWGTIVRRFEAWQWGAEGDLNANGILDREEALVSSNPCRQTITILANHTYTIDFPQDAITNYDEQCIWDLVISSGTDILGVNKGTPVYANATGDEAFQITIDYDIINWCVWTGFNGVYIISREDEWDGSFFDSSVESSERPVLLANNDGITIDRTNNIRALCPDGTGEPVLDDDSNLPDLTSAEEPELNDGRWVYTQYIKVYDNIAPTVVINTFGGATDDCPNLELGQFCAPLGENTIVNIPFSTYDIYTLFGITEESPVSLVSAQLDLFAPDLNGDGLIKEDEFVAEGETGNIMENITNNGNGTYLFSRSCPIIPHEMRNEEYHAIQLVLEDAHGNQVTKTIGFDVIAQESPNTVADMPNTGYILYQNEPNPFSNETVITFYMPIPGEVDFVFRDLQGRLLLNHKEFYPAGVNHLKTNKTTFEGASGIVTYTLSSGTFTRTRKMVIVD